MTKEERNIIKRLRQGNEQTFKLIYNAYWESLVEFAQIFVKDRCLAQEAVNDVFTTIWNNRRSLSINKSLSAYLYISVKNQAIKKAKTLNSFSYEEIRQDLDRSSFLSPEEIIIIKEEGKRVEKLLDLLPPRTKEIFIMHKFDRLKYREIAQILEISEKTVENHIVKAMRILREYYKNKKT